MSMPVKVSDLVLTDEHDTVSEDESLASAAQKLLNLAQGILIVLDDDRKVKGIVTSTRILQAVAQGQNPLEVNCGTALDSDVMEVGEEDLIHDIVGQMTERKPHAVVAVKASGDFIGYFSPNDYREALARIEARPAIRSKLLAED